VGALEDVTEAALMVGTARCAVRRMPPERDSYSRTPQRGVPTKPVRSRLPHDVPLWIDPSKEDYFITLCCERRGENLLATPAVGHPLLETIKHRQARGIWYPHLALVMPDHIHLILSFPEIGKRVQTIMSKWKEWTAKSLKIDWQRDFFEHRLRRDESFREKADYVLANPVRAGLVKKVADWPYVFIAEPW
jgi:putative transposase